MKTRKISIAIILMLSVSFAFAQLGEPVKTSFGILGGVNMQTFSGKDAGGVKLENDMLVGFHAGVNMLIPVAPEFYFQPGLLFTTKGAKNTNSLFASTYSISYIELPLNLVYRASLGNGYVLVGFGPYVAYGIMGKAKHEGGALSYESDIEFKNIVEIADPLTTSYFKALDAGGNVFVGYEMASGIFIQLNTQIGMLNIKPEDKRNPNDESAMRNTGFGLSLGYRL
ncbi:MAG: PorT family protein [Prolixibacteraceae bacterium]|nr:PorT family protein [Prolixibacteraceae bacterium]MBN2650077.1 PorT family protein [Prolixibacteraceae bacterium]